MSEGRSRVSLSVNATTREVEVRNDEVLLTTLRREFAITSVRGTCGIGICGTCSVLVEGKVASSCLMLSVAAEGKPITTSEGLGDGEGRLDAVQEAFVKRGAYQCSFCIPAMVVTVRALLSEHSEPTLEEIREYLGGNLCRCGTYPEIVEAVADLVGGGAGEGWW